MTPAKKLMIAAGALTAAYVLYKGKDLVSDISVKIAAFGKPQIIAGVFALPVQLAITNPNPLPIPVSNLRIDLFMMQNAGWIKVGETTPTGPFTIKPGNTMQVVNPTLSLRAFGTTLLEVLANVANIKPLVKAVAYINVQGIEITHERQFTL